MTTTRRRQSPEKRIQLDIRRALERLGFHVDDMTQPRRSMMPLGLPDLYARHAAWGVRIWIEVKTPRGKLSPYQHAWHEGERAAGGTVIVARSVDDAIDAIRPVLTRNGARRTLPGTTPNRFAVHDGES